MKTNHVREINELEFDAQVLCSKQPVLLGFVADWSHASRLFLPVLDEVADACNGQAKVFKINVDDSPDLGNSYHIRSLPTLLYFSNGTLRAKIIGMASAKAVLAKLQSLSSGAAPAAGT